MKLRPNGGSAFSSRPKMLKYRAKPWDLLVKSHHHVIAPEKWRSFLKSDVGRSKKTTRKKDTNVSTQGFVDVESLIMRSIRPTLQFARFVRQRSTPLQTSIPKSSIISPKSVSRRFYSEQQRQNPKPEENSEAGEKQEKEDPKKHYKEDTSPPPDPNKSPFQVFVDTFKSELSKSQELQESVKALQDESGKIGDSEALRRAKEAYAKARVLLTIISVDNRNNRTELPVRRGE
jgi:hypothetical protein